MREKTIRKEHTQDERHDAKKTSKKAFTRFILKFGRKYLTSYLFSYILFIRYFNKFKREIKKNKSTEKFSKNLDDINNFEFKLTSQNNEDGIIEHIFSKIPNKKNFVEVGFGFYEFNALNLIKNGWRGKLIDFDKDECLVSEKLLNFFYPKSNVQIINKAVFRDNINELVYSKTDHEEIDFFSLDIDGNDYWVLKELNTDKIKVICCEYNHYFGNNIKKTIPYNPNHIFKNNGCYGASLHAFHELLVSKGFSLVAIESSGTNAFFVKNEFAQEFEVLSPSKSWRGVDRHNTVKQIEAIKNSIKKFQFEEL